MRLRTKIWAAFTFVALYVTALLADKQPAYLGNDHEGNYKTDEKVFKQIDFAIEQLQQAKENLKKYVKEKEGK